MRRAAIYVVLFGITLWVLVWRCLPNTPVNKPMLVASTLMFIIATMVCTLIMRDAVAKVSQPLAYGRGSSPVHDCLRSLHNSFWGSPILSQRRGQPTLHIQNCVIYVTDTHWRQFFGELCLQLRLTRQTVITVHQLYRVFVIWNRDWRVCVAPLVLLAASISESFRSVSCKSER